MKPIKLFIVCFILSACSTTSKLKIESSETAIKYAHSISAEDLKKHLSVLASDEYEGRETGMPGQKKAAKYIQNFYEENGISGGMPDGTYQQSFPLLINNPKNIELSMLKYAESELEKPMKIDLKAFKDYYFFGGFGDTTISNMEVVFVGYGIKEKSFNSYTQTVKGKAVIMLEGHPEEYDLDRDWDNWRLKLKTAQQQGAVAMFTIKENFKESVESIRYFVENPNMQIHNKGIKKYNRIPNFYLPDSIAEIITSLSMDELENKSKQGESWSTNVRAKMRSFFKDTSYKSENILGFIEGTDLKQEVLVLSAHYDHIGYDNGEVCNGADDDGSGTVAVLEIAQAFAEAKKDGISPRRSILFLNVSGEEKGLLGSQYYTDNPVYPLENTIADLNIDMIGRTDTNHVNDQYVYMIGSDRLSSELDEIARACNKLYAQLELDYTFNSESDPNKFYYRSDHYNFAKKNIPVIFYFSGVHEDYHKPTDDVEKIMFPKTAQITKLIFHTAWELANRDKRPELNK